MGLFEFVSVTQFQEENCSWGLKTQVSHFFLYQQNNQQNHNHQVQKSPPLPPRSPPHSKTPLFYAKEKGSLIT